MVFANNNKVHLVFEVCLVRVCRGIWILFLVFVGKNKVILGSMCVWCGYAEVSGYVFLFL